MKFHKTLPLILASAASAFASASVDQFKFVEINGAPAGASLDSLAVADVDALTLGPGGSVTRLGSVPGGLRFGIESGGLVPNLPGARSITATPDFFIVGGDAGGLAVGRVSPSGINWQKVNVGTANTMNRLAIIGGNLVAITGSRKTFYGATNNLNSFSGADVLGGSFFETYNNVVGFSSGDGAIVGNSGVIRYSSNSGVTFVNARPFGSSTIPVTDAARLGGKLYATTADGSVLSSEIPSDLSKSPVGWNWQSVNVSGQRALRAIALHGEQLIVVGDAGAAFYLNGTNWTAISNLPASATSADLTFVEAPARGQFQGAVVVASKSSIYLGTPMPKPALLSGLKLETCSSNDISGKVFVAAPAVDPLDKFVQIDWLSGANRLLTNSTSFALFENRTGNFGYQAVARDYRSGVESVSVQVAHRVFQNPAAPVARQSLYEQCASDPISTLSVAPVEGVHFDWYDAEGRLLVSGVGENGVTYTPPVKVSGTYYVEAVAAHEASECRSVTRTRVDFRVNALPAAPKVFGTKLSIAACEDLPVLAVEPVSGVNFTWYSSATGGEVVSTNTTFLPTLKQTKTFYVEATSAITGCRSLERTPVTLTVRPAFQLTSEDVLVRLGETNKSVSLKVGMSADYKDYHTSRWSGNGDGAFADSDAFSTTYTPGTNDLANGIVRVSLQVSDSGVLCSAQTTEFRIVYVQAAPSLAISVDAGGVTTLRWPPAPGYRLVATGSLSLTEGEVVSDGEAGSLVIPVVEGVRFYRLVAQ